MTLSTHLVIAAATTIALVPVTDATARTATPPAQLQRVLVAEMNSVRADHALPPLRRAASLTRAAQSHSRNLVRRGVLSHEGPHGEPFWTRLVAAGFPRTRAMAENIAQVPGCGAAAMRRTVRMWMASPVHRANLLSSRYRQVGAGAACAMRPGLAMVTADYGA